MIFSIVIIALVAVIAYFHWVQGFFSATLSAIFSVIAAVVAFSYHETIIERFLGDMLGDWGPALVMLALFTLTYFLLRVIADKAIPGGVLMPSTIDKIGGAVMGLVAGAFAVGTVAIAAQQLPLGPSIAGYVRYETKEREAVVPQPKGERAFDALVFNEVVGDTFQPEKVKTLLVPVDDVVVNTVARLSDGGSLDAGKPLTKVHPDYLQELFGQRLGIEVGGKYSAPNLKNNQAVDVTGVYKAPPKIRTVDHEFKQVRDNDTAVKHPDPQPDEMRVVVRVSFGQGAADKKDGKIRLAPAAVRLVAKRVDDATGGDPVPHNYFPIGTIDPNGYLYFNKIDDPLYIESSAGRVDGSNGPSEVDFVFQVKKRGFLAPGEEDKPQPQIDPDTFIEVKRFGRVALEGDRATVKTAMKPPQSLALRRKRLDWSEGPAPLKAGEGAPAAAAAPVEAPAPSAAPAGGAAQPAAPAAPSTIAPDEAVSRMAGTWESASAGLTYTFRIDGTYTGQRTGADAKSADGKWRVLKVDAADGGTAEVELTSPSGKIISQRWRLGDGKTMTRIVGTERTEFTRKS